MSPMDRTAQNQAQDPADNDAYDPARDEDYEEVVEEYATSEERDGTRGADASPARAAGAEAAGAEAAEAAEAAVGAELSPQAVRAKAAIKAANTDVFFMVGPLYKVEGGRSVIANE